MKHICCNCKKEALIMPYVCADCLAELKRPEQERITAQAMTEAMTDMVHMAIEVLKSKGFAEEAKSLNAMLEATP